MRRYLWLALPLAAALVAGCGGAAMGPTAMGGQAAEPHIAGEAFAPALQPTGYAQAQTTQWKGRPALELSNGLVRVVAVPKLGGRVVSYRLGDYDYLWLDKALSSGQGAAPTAGDWGGDWVVPVSEQEPGGLPAATLPAALAGEWTGQVTTPRGLFAEVKLTSPEDKAGSGVQLTRVLRLYTGSTRLQITDSLTNLTDQPLTRGLRTVTQMVGVRGSGRPEGEVRAYLPLAPGDEGQGYSSLLPGGDSQYSAQDHLLQVAYSGYAGKVGAPDPKGWVACAETGGNYTFVRRFATGALGQNPDQGAQAEVYTAPWDDARGGYVALETLSPLRGVKPGESLSFAQNWYATVAPGPIVDAVEYAAFSQPPTLTREGDGFRLKGVLGVFAAGTLSVSVLDASGQPLGDPSLLQVSPATPVTLDQLLRGGLGASAVRLSLQNSNGTPLADLAQVPAPGLEATG